MAFSLVAGDPDALLVIVETRLEIGDQQAAELARRAEKMGKMAAPRKSRELFQT